MEVEVVSKLDSELYSFIKEKRLMVMDIGEVCNAIKDGIVLPKGHGNLIDSDTIDFDIKDFHSKGDWQVATWGVQDAEVVIPVDME